jgi:hypothetical protein
MRKCLRPDSRADACGKQSETGKAESKEDDSSTYINHHSSVKREAIYPLAYGLGHSRRASEAYLDTECSRRNYHQGQTGDEDRADSLEPFLGESREAEVPSDQMYCTYGDSSHEKHFNVVE